MTDARADFVGFGAPNWEGAAARHFGIDPLLMENRFADYTAANDPVLINGVERIGTTYFLPAFTGSGIVDAATAPVAAHSPTTYASALGLPDWLSTQDQEAATAVVNADFPTGNAIDPSYGPSGSLSLFVAGSRGDDVLAGLGGDDTIVGGPGKDIMSGASGADVFVFNGIAESGSSPSGSDAILDFDHLDGDKIDLSAIDARADMLGKQDFTFVQGTKFLAPGQVVSWMEGNTTWIAANTDWDASPEFMIRLDGRHVIAADDLILDASPGWILLAPVAQIGSLL
ncbi:M10 family metallopeptidase C-terminal domain-containing protein [Sphingomonas sp. BN140010]|uniref:M10 family metallopeptidase C-terminal domain-containing protein n=1 Tax=Sphingomonas arvum TaxID=2992113 RepID=A0ABT3JF22_9SPHN|nr:M10 family metallopeptidase C-terminal domain-containing protein [Sphingomonas sp. BN140010]MCW3797609.1 M10 family metallopeptidase C-terminal domain-containing protein [Sphingomonas sp. BN140010]